MNSGFLLIDKPAGITSHDVVDRVRRVTGLKKVGHGGTLDPFATGLLVVGVGREATRELGSFIGHDKEYEAVMALGASSDTQDRDGQIIETPNAELPTESELKESMGKFVGHQQQVPPMYSAKKIKGKKMYELARQGLEVEREPVEITVHELELLNYESPHAKFRASVSSGTYIRTLAHDIGRDMGCGAYLEELRRTKIGSLNIDAATVLADLKPENWVEKLQPVTPRP